MPGFTKALLAVASCACMHAQEPSPVYFNHTTLYVTPATYQAFKSSPLLKDEFSGSSETTISADGGTFTYTGFYIHGMHTYIELFESDPSHPSPEAMVPAGQIDVGMWIDYRSQLPQLRDRLQLPEVKTRRTAENQPAFDYLSAAASERKRVATWVMARYPDGVPRRTRPTYLADRLYRDVVAYTVTVGTAEREELTRWFRAYGYTIRQDREKRIANGPEFVFTMLPEPANGVRTASIEMSLNREKSGRKTYKIGDGELKFNKDRATLTFRFPNPN